MKRWSTALAVLLMCAVSVSYADYVKIMFNVGGSPEQQAARPPGAPAGGGGDLGTGGGGGAQIGGPGAPGKGGGRLPGGIGGPLGGGGGSSDTPTGGGGPGVSGGGGIGDLGNPGGGGGPSLGSPTGGGNIGDLSGSLNPGAGLDSRAIWVEGVVEFDNKDARADKTRTLYLVKHKFGPNGQGQTWLPIPMPNNPNVKIGKQGVITAFITPEYRLYHIQAPTMAQRLEAKKKDLAKTKQDSNAAALMEFAQWCLQHGQLDEVAKTMEKAAKLEPKNPIIAAFQKTEAAVNQTLKPGDGEVWRERLGNFRMLSGGKHYHVVYEDDESLAGRLRDRLESNYRAFYYWWALKGIVPPQPERRLTAILVQETRSFEHQHREIFDRPMMAADGFLARRDNVAIISARRLDGAYDALSKYAKPFTLGTNPETLLKGAGFQKGKNPYETATAQTLTLLQAALQEESDLMTATHEGTRQLIAAIGLLPRNVIAPQWIDFGMGSVFETPKGAFWPGTGAPSWTHLDEFKRADKDKKLEKADTALRGVVTDRYFREAHELAEKEKTEREKARTAKAGDPPPPAPEPDKDTADKVLARGRAQAWGLTYFLAQTRLPQLLRYYGELQQLPRDLQFDEDVLWQTFLRAFDLVKPGDTAEDRAKVFILASEWQKYLRGTPLPGDELRRDVARDLDKKPARP
jgi:hypothetical protein